jgi:hypothetical protein
VSYIGKYLGRYVGSYLGTVGTLVVFPDPPGSTIDALGEGHGSLGRRWVFAVEGYENLVTDVEDPTAAVVAWDGTDWEDAGAVGGLYVNLEVENSIHPYDPFRSEGGRLTVRVAPDRADTFGIALAKKSSGETFLDASIDCDDTTARVRFVGNLPAAPGTVHIGTEAIGFTGTASSPVRLTGLTRGKYSPFLTAPADDGGHYFAHQHVVSDDPLGFKIPPVVASSPRHWIGKWAGLWMHRYSAQTGLLNLKEDAQLVFAGRIKAYRDNPQNTTDLEIEHVLRYVKNAVLGDDMWTATIKEGLYLQEGWEFGFSDTANIASPPVNEAQNLVVDSGSASGPYSIKPGRYTLDEIYNKLNAWLAQALDDGDIAGTYQFSRGVVFNAGPRTVFDYRIPGSGDPTAFWFLSLPKPVYHFLGRFDTTGSSPLNTGINTLVKPSVGGFVTTATDGTEFSTDKPLRHMNNAQNNLQTGAVFDLENERGTFFSQGDRLPPLYQALLGTQLFSGQAGAVLFDGNIPAVVLKNSDELTRSCPVDLFGTGVSNLLDLDFEIAIDDTRGPIKVQQYFHYVDTPANLIKQIFYSTGTDSFNTLQDVLPKTLGLAVPGELLGEMFEASIDALPGMTVPMNLIITKPVKIVDLLGGDLKIRFAFLRWKDQHLQFWSWMTPTSAAGLLELTEENKAAPAGTRDKQRCVTVTDESFTRNVVKLQYERDFTISDSKSAFRKDVNVVDRVAIDDAGGTPAVETVSAQNSYSGSFLGAGGGIEDLVEPFAAHAALFTHSISIITRPIDSRLWENCAVGDGVMMSDNFARDPDTGRRRVSQRPAIIIDHRWNPGGGEPGGTKARPMTGDVKLMLLDNVRAAPYVPTAQVDHDAANGGYDAGTHVITTLAHAHSGSTAAADASYMSAGRKARIVEIDPPDPADPLSWDVTVLSQTGNTITLAGALAGDVWDPDRYYRVIFDDYDDVISNQHNFSYQADDTDGDVGNNSRAPYQYIVGAALLELLQLQNTGGPLAVVPTSDAANDQVELPPDSSHGDGTGLDVGTQAALLRLENNELDYKTAKSEPKLFQTAMTVLGDVTHNWMLRLQFPHQLSADGLSSRVRRLLYVAPQFKCTGGGPIDVRVSIVPSPVILASNESVDRGSVLEEVTFSTSSATYEIPDVQGLDLTKIKDSSGLVWVLVELRASHGSDVGSCRGLATFYEGPRVYSV